MTGLLLQELFSLKKIFLWYLFIIVGYSFIGILTNGNPLLFSSCVILLCVFFVINSFSIHEKSHWDLFVNTMLVSRNQIVFCFYLLSDIFMMISLSINLVFSGICTMFFHQDWTELFISNFTSLGIGILYTIIIIPLIMKFGSDKGRIILLVLFLISFFIIMAYNKTGLPLPSTEQLKPLLRILPLFLAAITCISIWFSAKIYKHKNF